MKQWLTAIVLIGMVCNGADNRSNMVKLNMPSRLNVAGNIDSPRKRSKSVVERILGDQLLSERESSPRSREILQIWNSKNNDPVPGVSATLCKIVRSKSVPQVEVESPKDPSLLTQEQISASTLSRLP